MTDIQDALGRCLYEQGNLIGPPWKQLSEHTRSEYRGQASRLIGKLDQHGIVLTYVPPES